MASRDVRFCGKQTVLPLCFVLFVLFAACGGEADDPGGAAADVDLSAVVTERIGPYEHLLGDIAYDDPLPSGGDHAPLRTG